MDKAGQTHDGTQSSICSIPNFRKAAGCRCAARLRMPHIHAVNICTTRHAIDACGQYAFNAKAATVNLCWRENMWCVCYTRVPFYPRCQTPCPVFRTTQHACRGA